MKSDVILTVENLEKTYVSQSETLTVLKNLSFSVNVFLFFSPSQHIRKMRSQPLKHLKSEKPDRDRHDPEIKPQLRPLPEKIAGEHAVAIARHYIVKRIQL